MSVEDSAIAKSVGEQQEHAKSRLLEYARKSQNHLSA